MRWAYLTMFSIIVSLVQAQTNDASNNFSRMADDIIPLDEEDEAGDLEARYENLSLLLANPVDLNKVNQENLRQFYFLSESQIQNFLRYREAQGNLLSVYELQAIPGFDQITIGYLAPLVKVVDEKTHLNRSILNRIFSTGNSYLITRVENTLEEKNGFSSMADSTHKYLGSSPRIFTRIRSAIPYDYSIGVTLEKDGGEQISFNPTQRKFGGDFSSLHVQLQNKGPIRNIVLGDYQAQFGQGVILGGAFGLGKGAETITTTRRTNIGFVPHTSAGETGFYRGAALSYQLQKNISISPFISQARRDATLAMSDQSTTISAFQYSGSHRNLEEQSRARSSLETVAGTVLQFRKKNFDAGFTVQYITFNYPVHKNESVYNQFAFSGKSNLNMGAFYNYTFNNFCFFGEFAKSQNAGKAWVTGMIGSLSSSFDIAMVARHYEKDYYAFYANSFSESTQPQNENGLYWGVKYKWNKRLSFASYVDLFRFPWLGFRRYAPSNGAEWLARLTYQPSKKISMFAQIRQESKARNIGDETVQYIVRQGLKSNYWASINLTEGVIRFRTRIQYSTYEFNFEKSHGIVMLQGVGFELGKLQLTGHYALFQTEDFDNRQYVYENDVYLAFSLPSYDGEGVRSMVMAEYKISKALTIYARYARSYYNDKSEIGTGAERIEGNTKNDVKFQAVIRF